MQILEVKNNLLKISFSPEVENVVLSGFVNITNEHINYIAQVINIEAKQNHHFAVLKAVFKADDNDGLIPYDGSAISLKSRLNPISFADIMSMRTPKEPLFLGQVEYEKYYYNVDFRFLKKNLLVCVEHEDEKDIFENSIISQIVNNKKRAIIFDITGNSTFPKKLVMGKDFKLPLNYETIDYIYEKGLTNASVETKALVQDIFLEVQNYVRQLPDKFIPFENFKEVVDAQYEETQLKELVLLKNKLMKYYEKGIFAQDKFDFENLELNIINNYLTVIDISKFKGSVQREVISYVYSILKDLNGENYSFVEIDDDNTDKRLLKQIFTTKNIHSIIISPYKYKYLKEIKQLSKNLVLFSPIQQQDDFAGYNILLSRLNHNEFIAYGDGTMYVPCMLTLNEKEVYPEQEEDFDVSSIKSAKDEQVISNQEEDYDELPPIQDDEVVEFVDENAQYQQEEDYDELPPIQDDEDYNIEYEQEESYEDLPPIEDDVSADYGEEIINPQYDDEEDMNIVYEDSESEYQDEDELDRAVVENVDKMQSVPASQLQQDEGALTEDDLDFIEENAPIDMESLEQPSQEVQSEEIKTIRFGKDKENEQNSPVPVYPSEKPEKSQSGEHFQKGDTVMHEKFGKGVVLKVIEYGEKNLCSIEFEQAGKKFLDPDITKLTKI